MGFHLDHVIILVPYAWLSTPPSWITANFTITPGGRHADGKTENFLVIFQDGFYIEFIAFINDDPAKRDGHWWGSKNYGIIDFAVTSTTEDASTLYSRLRERLATLDVGDLPQVQYQAPLHGGRTRPDGQKIEWDVTFPVVDTGYQRGELPFFCQDRTPRELRVPVSEACVRHPCGAYGVEEFYVFVSGDKADALANAYATILDTENSVSDSDPNFVGTFELKRLGQVAGADGDGSAIVVGVPFEEDQLERMESMGGLLLANLTLGSVNSGILKRIDLGADSVGGIVAPAV